MGGCVSFALFVFLFPGYSGSVMLVFHYVFMTSDTPSPNPRSSSQTRTCWSIAMETPSSKLTRMTGPVRMRQEVLSSACLPVTSSP